MQFRQNICQTKVATVQEFPCCIIFVYLPVDSCDQEMQAALNLSAVYKAVNVLWVHGLSGGRTGARTRWMNKKAHISTPLQQNILQEIIWCYKIIAILFIKSIININKTLLDAFYIEMLWSTEIYLQYVSRNDGIKSVMSHKS